MLQRFIKEIIMQPTGFIYVWFDTARKMFYVGSHSGVPTDSYLSSSRWLNGEINYRPQDFKRRIVKYCYSKEELLGEEHKLLNTITESEFGVRYYNLKQGRKKGTPASNKGKKMSDNQKYKLSKAMKGRKLSEEHKKKLSESMMGNKNWQSIG